MKKYIPPFLKTKYHETRLAIKKTIYKGHKYYCVCCDESYSTFLDMKEGSHPRKAVVCPGCESVERHRMLLRFLKEKRHLLFPKGARVLYIAPMLGIKKYFSSLNDISYLDADLVSPFAQAHFDLMDIPHPTSSFDFCICSHTLAHVKNDKKALAELHRVLSPKGVLLVMERIYPIDKTVDLGLDLSKEERLNHYDQTDRWRKYGKDFAERMSGVGFQVEQVSYAATLDAETLEKEQLDKSELLFLGAKK